MRPAQTILLNPLHYTVTKSPFTLLEITMGQDKIYGWSAQVATLRRLVASIGSWVAKLGRWVAKLGRWMATFGSWVAKFGKWVTNLVALLLATAAL